MPVGPGKYGAIAEQVLLMVGGRLCVVIVLDGVNGSSFDVASADPKALLDLPETLRKVADNVQITLNEGI